MRQDEYGRASRFADSRRVSISSGRQRDTWKPRRIPTRQVEDATREAASEREGQESRKHRINREALSRHHSVPIDDSFSPKKAIIVDGKSVPVSPPAH